MNLSEPLPRLLRLRGMVARAVPTGEAKLSNTDAQGLTDAYNRLRDATRELASDLGIAEEEFDAQLPALDPATERPRMDPTNIAILTGKAKSAAVALGSLAGYVEGLIEAVVLDQQITMEQVQAAREAARQPPGFR